jgi:hypothetical protein
MLTLNSAATLPLLLVLDALLSAATGMAMIIAADLVEPLLNVPAAVMRSAGVLLLPFAGMVFFFSRPLQLTRSRVLLVIALNLVWVAASVLVLVTGWIQPTTVGVAFVLLQAVLVAALAELQFAGLRRSFAAAT